MRTQFRWGYCALNSNRFAYVGRWVVSRSKTCGELRAPGLFEATGKYLRSPDCSFTGVAKLTWQERDLVALQCAVRQRQKHHRSRPQIVCRSLPEPRWGSQVDSRATSIVHRVQQLLSCLQERRAAQLAALALGLVLAAGGTFISSATMAAFEKLMHGSLGHHAYPLLEAASISNFVRHAYTHGCLAGKPA